MKKIKFILLGTIIFIFFKIFLGYEKNPPEIFGDTIRWKGSTYIISQGGHKEGKRIAKGDGFSLFSVGISNGNFCSLQIF
ncbi:hypothetical protein QCB49_10010 (plasmid) [Cetobacterium somerae]|uniref:hypothetical protein n=1 Tax=Cetobacterium somerae TaxID=188913 RepID=UPI0038920F76